MAQRGRPRRAFAARQRGERHGCIERRKTHMRSFRRREPGSEGLEIFEKGAGDGS
jgi:hypothetical protein